jgi:hypothetical protein
LKSNIKKFIIFLLAPLFAFLDVPAQAGAPSAAGEPTYLVFQLGTENRNFEGLVPEVKAEFGAQPAGSPRYIGFGVALLTFKTPIDELRRIVTRALDMAEESGLPIYFQLDDMNFMPEYSDDSMVEWTAFPKPGETIGPRAKYYWLNWGSWQALPPTPNFESPAIRQEISKRLKEGVLPPLLERLARWKKQKRSYLFAGICVGWETGIPEYRSFRQAGILARDKQQQITMTEAEQSEQLGYASLHARGWTQQKIEERARQSGESVEDVTTDLLFEVIHDYTAFWARTAHDAGIPKERIYTHGVAWESLPDPKRHSPAPWAGKSSRIPPLWVTINPYCRPGYTVGNGMVDAKGLVRILRAAGVNDGWGGVEAYVRGVESETAFGGYLRQLFDNGASLLDIWGWTAPGTPYDPKRAPGALRAVHTWLEGKELPLTEAAGGLPPGTPPSLREKLTQLGSLFMRRNMQGVDLQPASDLMRDFRPLLEQQKFSEAEALVDRVLKLLEESSPPAPPPQRTPGAIPQSLQEKMARLQALANQRRQEGFDLQPVMGIAQGVQPLIDQQKFGEAEALVDRALKLLGESSTPAPQPPETAPGAIPQSLQEKMARLQALAHKREQEGFDLQPVMEIAKGVQPLIDQQKFGEAEALVDRALKLLDESSPPAPPPQTTPGAIPQSLQEKMARLQALARQRQQEGVDIEPVAEIANGVQPLLEQQKFGEAEALVDRALALLSQSGAVAKESAIGDNPFAKPADAKPLPCPAAGTAIELASGNWFLGGGCTATGLGLRGDAQLWVEGLPLTVDGNLKLEENSGLHIRGGSFTIANQFKLEYHIEAKDKALFDIRDAKFSSNGGVTANLTSSYQGSGDSRLHIENVQIDPITSWLLANLRDRARLETKDSPHFPPEIYPTESSTVRIEGPRSEHGVWLRFSPGSSAVLDSLPSSHPHTFSFGRNTPEVKGIGYQVDVVNGNAGFSISSYPHSNVTLKNGPTVGVGYEFSDVTTPESITGLKGGRQTGTYHNQDRVLDLENSELPPYGWQLYSSNSGVPLAKVAPVTVTDSLINEMGASKQGWFEVEHVQFAFAAVAAVGPSSRVHVRDSVINSHTIMGNSDGVVKIENSEIYGSRVQAIGHSRILLLNTALRTNERHPKCVPLIPSPDGKPTTRCNPYNPAHEVQFITSGEGAIWVAGIDPIATAIRSGNTYTFVGDAIFKTTADAPYTYNLRYRRTSASKFAAIVTGGLGPKRGQPLGQLDTTRLAPGDYVVELELSAPGLEPVAVQRAFTINAP